LRRSLRKRYVGFRLASSQPYTRHQVVRLIFSELSTLKPARDRDTHIRLIDYDADQSWGIVMCDHRSVDQIRVLVHHINTTHEGQLALQIVGVSGTLKALKRKLLSTIQ
jgi:RNase P/RNase MRP subunit POP5